ncbi:MAG: TonB-dependent receptor [Bacteroidia bacterium]|nr:TonB-dependent receptor [Bacteroidia bacterium]NNF30663.1 TonB-dependent receptor [Flavobacteriaceae bacterium]MBT8277292.1 TonB-dependent receptor [Bacteroidia bacterium]NNJ80859.1 TonB-dependent receptor [Flavobacteriaceae bacterium]NNK54892.1 TonB-dependent receptor [Flavobacteriaceae bacterium]
MRNCLLIVIALFSFTLSAQQIQVLDAKDRQPLSGVAVYNENTSKNGITDLDGIVDISKFSDEERITFQHISHLMLTLSKQEIIASGNIVVLQSDASQLAEVVVSVSKFGQQKRDIPQQIVSVTSADVLFLNPQTAADLLESSGQVYVQKSQLGGGSPLIRGFSTNRLLITVDGVRFNTAIFRGGNVQNVISIDPFAVDRTEVILGPGSVVYGSDAVGGVMNFYTKNPKFSFEEGIALSGRVTGRYATANSERTGHVELNIGHKEWAFLTSVTYSDFDDLKMGKYGPDDYLRNEYVDRINGEDVIVTNPDPRVQIPTGYDQINAMQKIRFMPSTSWDFKLGLFYTTTSNYPRYDRLYRTREGQLRSAEWYYGPQEWMSGNLQATNKAKSAIYDESILTLSYQRFKESRNDRDFGDVILFENDEKVNAYSGGLDFTKKLNKATIFYGLEYVYNKVNSEGKDTNINTGISVPDISRYPDGATWQSMAAYSSLQLKLNKDLSFQGGLRYNHILVDASFVGPFYDFPFTEANIDTGALTGSAGLAWQASKILGWKLNFGTAFRAPNVDDIGKVFDSEPGSVVVPNPDLEAEYAYNYELGANLNFSDVVKIELAGYITQLKDALVRRDFELDGLNEIEYQGELSNVQAIQNAAKAEVYGFEAGVEVNFNKDLQLTSQYNITDGFEEDDEGNTNPIRHAAPQFGNSHLIWKKGKLKLDAFAEYNGQFDFEDLAPSQQNNDFLYAKDANGNPFSPSWYTLNLGGAYEINKSLSLNAVLENITNQRYRSYSSGITAPGTNLIVAATFIF